MKSTFVKKIMTVEITNTNYETLFQNNPGLCILEFGGAHCAPCVILLQHLDALSMEYKDEVLVGTVDYYAFSDLAIKFGVRATPTLLFIKNGEILEKQVGYSSKKILEDKIKRHLLRD